MDWGDTCHDAGSRSAGDVIEVTTSGGPADVRLLDGPGYRDRRAGRPTASHVERAAGTPVRLAVPRAGRWYVTVDFGACLASVRSGIRVLPPDEGLSVPEGRTPPAPPRPDPTPRHAEDDLARPRNSRGTLTSDHDGRGGNLVVARPETP